MCCTAYVPSAITKQTSSTSWPWKRRSVSPKAAAPITAIAMSEPASTVPANAALRTTGPPPISRDATVGDRAADLLLEGEEEAGCHHEHQDPEAVERGVLRLGEALEREDLEPVGRDPGDQQAEPDRVRSLGNRQLSGRVDEPLCALGHRRRLGCRARQGTYYSTGSGERRPPGEPAYRGVHPGSGTRSTGTGARMEAGHEYPDTAHPGRHHRVWPSSPPARCRSCSPVDPGCRVKPVVIAVE